MSSTSRSEMQDRLTTATSGRLCCQVWLGYGSVLFIGFGDSVLLRDNEDSQHPRPEYELQAYEGEWTLHWGSIRIARFNDIENPDRIATAVTLTRALLGQSVTEAKVLSNRLDVLIRFGNDASLTVEPPDDPEVRNLDAWLIRFPTGVHYLALCDGQTDATDEHGVWGNQPTVDPVDRCEP